MLTLRLKQNLMTDVAGQNNDLKANSAGSGAIGKGFLAVVKKCDGLETVVRVSR